MPLWLGLAGHRHYPLLKVDTGKSRQLDDCQRNYRSDQNGLEAQKNQLARERGLVARSWAMKLILFFTPAERTTDTAMICCESGDI